MARPDPERVWLGFAQAALSGMMAIDQQIDPALRTWDEANRELAADCAAVADEMLMQWRIRYDEPVQPSKLPKADEPNW